MPQPYIELISVYLHFLRGTLIQDAELPRLWLVRGTRYRHFLTFGGNPWTQPWWTGWRERTREWSSRRGWWWRRRRRPQTRRRSCRSIASAWVVVEASPLAGGLRMTSSRCWRPTRRRRRSTSGGRRRSVDARTNASTPTRRWCRSRCTKPRSRVPRHAATGSITCVHISRRNEPAFSSQSQAWAC